METRHKARTTPRLLVVIAGWLVGSAMAAQSVSPSADSPNRALLIDIPGVGWSGDPRAADWGDLLGSRPTTVHVRHQGSDHSLDKWRNPGYDRVVTLEDASESELAKLDAVVAELTRAGKDVHVVVDKNITMSRHLTVPKPAENRWAAQVADHLLQNVPNDYFKILAMHSNGTVTPAYMKSKQWVDYVIISSPRGDQGIRIDGFREGAAVDIIIGRDDAPAWRWGWLFGNGLAKRMAEAPHLRVIRLEDSERWGTIHSQVQDVSHRGQWRVMQGGETRDFQGTLGELLAARCVSAFPLMAASGSSTDGVGITQEAFVPERILSYPPVAPLSENGVAGLGALEGGQCGDGAVQTTAPAEVTPPQAGELCDHSRYQPYVKWSK